MKRRRNNGVWLPPSPYDRLGQAPDTAITSVQQCAVGGVEIPTATGAAGASANSIVPLVGDFNEEDIAGVDASGPSLADMTYGYSLKRIVGKLFIGATDNTPVEASGYSWFVTAGIMVRRTQDTGAAAVLDTFTDTYAAARDPWVWRRSWVIANETARSTMYSDRTPWPVSTADYHSVADGPHVDAKTRRTVKAEERLFMSITLTNMQAVAMTETVFDVYWDFRFFGKVFQSAGNRGNASR